MSHNLNVVETTYRRVVDHGKTYLLRLVNSVVAADMFFAIAEHNLTIVGVGANYIKPITTSYIIISPGQTMDILLIANQTLGHYYIAARQFWSQGVGVTDFDQVNVTAIIEYRGNYTIPLSPSFPSTLPTYKDITAAIKFSNLFRSLASKDHPVNVPLNITTRMYVTLSISEIACENSTCTTLGGGKILATSANNISWNNPNPIDILLAYYRFFPSLSLFYFFLIYVFFFGKERYPILMLFHLFICDCEYIWILLIFLVLYFHSIYQNI